MNPFDDYNPWPSLSSDIGKALAQLLGANQFPAERIALLFNRSDDDVMKALSGYTDEPKRARQDQRKQLPACDLGYEDI